jgi:2-polyprenyl-6-methoxyphenol hydroxylase-like FAD-dependent oxidoreductase
MLLKIAIVGAGPAVCLLARLLLQADQKFDVTIFEAEPDINFRARGGTLDLHEATGLAALKKAGLFDQFLVHARYDGDAIKIADKHLLCYVNLGASKKGYTAGRPEIDRPRLRELLFHSLPARTVQWNKKLVRVDESRCLHFADGTSRGGFNLIVGADGAWSRVRALLSDVQPYYSGIGGYSLTIRDAEKTTPDLYCLLNRGSLSASSDGRGIMAQYIGDGSINTAAFAARSEDWQRECQYDVDDPEAVRRALRKEYLLGPTVGPTHPTDRGHCDTRLIHAPGWFSLGPCCRGHFDRRRGASYGMYHEPLMHPRLT